MRALEVGPLTVTELALVIGRKVPATSQHLRRLRELGLVERERRGGSSQYRIQPGPASDRVCTVLGALETNERAAS
jgi:DNA-binding transcriptional ArsR family regulator